MSGMILSILWINVAWISSVYGQTAFPQFPGGTPSNTSRAEVTTKPSAIQPSSSSSSSTEKSQLSSPAVKHGVRITLPVRDQKVPAGAILTISGVSKEYRLLSERY